MTDQKKFPNFDTLSCEEKCNTLELQLEKGDPYGLVRDQAGIHNQCVSFDASVFRHEGTCSITTIMKDADGYEEQESVPVCDDGNPELETGTPQRRTIEGRCEQNSWLNRCPSSCVDMIEDLKEGNADKLFMAMNNDDIVLPPCDRPYRLQVRYNNGTGECEYGYRVKKGGWGSDSSCMHDPVQAADNITFNTTVRRGQFRGDHCL